MITIKKAENNSDLEVCSSIRKSIFSEVEQGPKTLYIIDKLDKKETTANYILFVDNIPTATVRYIEIDKTTVKIQRLATLPKYQRKGFGSLILKRLEDDARQLGYKKIVLDSAQKSIGFYLKHNYIPISEIFYEDKRPHQTMIKKFK